MINKLFKVKFIEEEPKYITIANHIKSLIEDKKIDDGEKLPTIRELSAYLGVNNVTIVSAYKKLVDEGFAKQKMGSGTYAKRKEISFSFNKTYSNTIRKMNIMSHEDIIDFSGETVKENIIPIEHIKESITYVLDRDGATALISQNPLGYDKLRSAINDVLWGGKLNSEDILIISGAQQGIDIASKTILNINDNVIVEKPTYGGALSVFKWRRANIFEVDMEEDGVDIEAFEKILKKNKIRIFYTMSYFQNPTGISYSREKKERIIQLAKKYDFYIIEDDYLSELIYDKSVEYAPYKWLDKDDRVIYIKSFSKIFLPGIRIGYIIAPKVFKESIRNSKFNTDIATSSLMQRVLEMYIQRGYWRENIHFLNEEYKDRYNYMAELLNTQFKDMISYKEPGGGLSFYVHIENSKINSRKLFLELSKKGVIITPGVLFFSDIREGDKTFKISFAQTDINSIKKGLDIIREELEKWHI